MKKRQGRNRIDTFFTSDGTLLKTPAAIEEEITGFYKALLGFSSDSLPGVDLGTVRRGAQLSRYSQQSLIAPISTEEIDLALKDIDSSKAPGIDGFNSHFFKKACDVVKNDVYAGVMEFFNIGVMLRLANVISEVIDGSQAGFIPRKHIGDNILLATELIKGYGHKFLSPRCMLKIDLKKAYDSVEWGNLKTIMSEIGFPN
ncbi:uncharacterized protein LOC110729967 [Chenopodium quinoa]|uniref:uncharacterized protein LOC110729967 n=1 Tax=Chenopodium quinoa TaxID=63459 RepID=UPI000B789E88|nr:uncharacterized protein LOC110729967 [Chenopodium quinoa]